MTHEEVQWIKYQMALNKITQSDIATIAGCSLPMVSQVIHGRKRSANVQSSLVKALGYDSFKKLIEAADRDSIA
jgi:predicted transcriptional regulator